MSESRGDLINAQFEIARLTAKLAHDKVCILANEEFERQVKPLADERYTATYAAEVEYLNLKAKAQKERDDQLNALSEASK